MAHMQCIVHTHRILLKLFFTLELQTSMYFVGTLCYKSAQWRKNGWSETYIIQGYQRLLQRKSKRWDWHLYATPFNLNNTKSNPLYPYFTPVSSTLYLVGSLFISLTVYEQEAGYILNRSHVQAPTHWRGKRVPGENECMHVEKIQTPSRKIPGWGSNPGPSYLQATVLPTAPPCSPVHPVHFKRLGNILGRSGVIITAL